MGRPALGADDSLATDEQRSAREPELRQAIEAWAATQTVASVVAQLEAVGVPTAPIWNIAQALDSPQARARELLRPVDDPRLPDLRLPTQPVRFGGAAPNCARSAPALGEHSHEVIASLLGLGLDKLAELQALGVFGEAHEAPPAAA